MNRALLLLLATLGLASAIGVFDAADDSRRDLVARVLDEDGSDFVGETGAIPVDEICTAYMSSGELSCECKREGAKSVQLDCINTVPSCSLNNETCIEVRFETILDPIGPFEQASPFMTTCTDWVTEERRLETCIEVQPGTIGAFNETVQCGASYDGKQCNSCQQCEGYGYTTVSVDCTNVERGAEMTCGNVTENGLAVFVSDNPAPSPDESAASSWGAVFALVSLLISLVSLF